MDSHSPHGEEIISIHIGSEESRTSPDQVTPTVFSTATVQTDTNREQAPDGETFYLNAADDLDGAKITMLESMATEGNGWSLFVAGNGITGISHSTAQAKNKLFRKKVTPAKEVVS